MSGVYQLTPDFTVQAVRNGNDLWATLDRVPYDRDCIRINVNGPTAARAEVYKDMVSPQTRVDSTTRGGTNTADYSGGPLYVMRNGTLIVVWPDAFILDPNATADATFYFKRG